MFTTPKAFGVNSEHEGRPSTPLRINETRNPNVEIRDAGLTTGQSGLPVFQFVNCKALTPSTGASGNPPTADRVLPVA
jgi:hypothetical protein